MTEQTETVFEGIVLSAKKDNIVLYMLLGIVLLILIFAIGVSVRTGSIKTDIAALVRTVNTQGTWIQNNELYTKELVTATANIVFWMETVSSDSVVVIFLNKSKGLGYKVPMLARTSLERREKALDDVINKGNESLEEK